MTKSSDESYVQTYQKYLKHKGDSEILRNSTLSHTTSTKVFKPLPPDQECKICKVLVKPGDVCRVLHQGLYHKYTSSQDYFYTRDINALLMRKRKPFCIRYYDDLVYDECKERMKGFFRRKETKALMSEIKQFYTKFKNFPRNFHPNFYQIINSNIRKQRRLEYIRVFNNINLDDDKNDDPDNDDDKDSSKLVKDFNFMELLGNSFLQENYKDVSNVVIGNIELDNRRNTEQLLKEIDTNFKALHQLPKNTINEPHSTPFSNAIYNKNYMLYSRNDSETAENMLRQIVNEFRDVDFSRKASMTLAEQVLHQAAAAPNKSSKKPENKSPLKNRGVGESELSPTVLSKASSGLGNAGFASSLYQGQNKKTQPTSTGQRGPSNPRTYSQIETDSSSTLAKVSQNKLVDPRKSNSKLSLENLNDIAISREQILSNLYQFRSTRTKSGTLKSTLPSSKTPSSQSRRPVGGVRCNTQGFDSVDSKQIQTACCATSNYKSQSPSPDRKRPKEEPEKVSAAVEIFSQSKDSPYYNPMKRSTSNGPNADLKEVGSPTSNQNNKSIHKKSSSLAKKGAASMKAFHTTPLIQNLVNTNTSGINNTSQTNHENSSNAKFINPLRTTPVNQQSYYLRHQSPIDDKTPTALEGYQKFGPGNKMKSLNIRALKSTSPKGLDNYRVATMSMSGRHQNLLDLSQGVGSFVCNQTQASLHVSKHNSQPVKRKKTSKIEAQTFGSKVVKRSSFIQNHQINAPTPEEIIERDRKSKKNLDLSESNLKSFKDLKLQSKDQTPSNFIPSSTTSLNKLKVEVKKALIGSYTVKGTSKDLRSSLKK